MMLLGVTIRAVKTPDVGSAFALSTSAGSMSLASSALSPQPDCSR
jgi:hypothetical protein